MADTSYQRRSLFAVFLTVFIDLIGFGMFIPVLVTVATQYGASATEAASINTWYSVGTLLAVVLLGRLSDKVGRRPLLLATVLVSALAHLATGFAPDFLTLLVVRFVAGAAAGNISVAQAAIADLTAPSKRASAMVLIGIAFGGGFALGPALGALIARTAGEHFLPAVGITAFILNMINLGFVSRFLVESHTQFAGESVRELQSTFREEERPGPLRPAAGGNVFRDFFSLASLPDLRIVFLMQFLQVFGFVGLETVLPLVLRDSYGYSTAQTYDAFLILGLAVLFLNGVVARRVLARINERLGVKIGQFALCLGIACVHLAAPHSFGLVSALFFIATGTAFTNPSVSSLTSKLCPPEQLGLSFGALQVVGALARILGPASIGFFYDLLGGSESLWVTVTLIALASLTSFWIPHARKQT